jgi:tetratricopeptide (TPR) repeat protein
MGKFISHEYKLQIKHSGVNKLNLLQLLKDNLNCGLKEVMDLVNNIEKAPLNIDSSQLNGKNIEIIFKEIQGCGAVVEIIKSPLKSASRISDDRSGIDQFISELYSNAAFASYIIGDDEKSIKYQAKVLNYQNIPIARFTLAKYQLRNGNKEEAINNLDTAINEAPKLLLGVFKEIDFLNEPKVINLITEKNDKIDEKINEEIEKWKKIESTLASDVLKELTELSQQSYEIKVSEIKSFEKKANDINNNIGITESEIDSYISEIKRTTFCTLDVNVVQTIINELLKAKDLPLEKMLEVFEKIKKQVDADRIKIGSKYAGGIVFYIDKTGNHGLVCTEEDLGEAIYCYGEFKGATGNGIFDGSGMENTKKIVDYASSKVGLFGKKKVITAARLCLESNHKGYNDWYLPTLKEFEQIRNLKKVNLKKGCGYWSSSIKNDEITFWNFAVDTNLLFAIDETLGIRVKSKGVARNTLLKVRAVRAF